MFRIFASLRKLRHLPSYMYYLAALLITSFSSISFAYAQSELLENVKRKPEEAKLLCKSFRVQNSKGISSYSKQALKEIEQQRNLNPIDAEILSVYVIGMYCPEIF